MNENQSELTEASQIEQINSEVMDTHEINTWMRLHFNIMTAVSGKIQLRVSSVSPFQIFDQIVSFIYLFYA